VYAAPFAYARAGSFDEAVALLAEAGEDARVIAGGQSLVPLMMLRMAQPSLLVDIGGAGPRSIERVDGRLVVSALARHADLQRSAAVAEACPLLAEAAAHIGNVRVRHRGTLGGSLAHAEATAELPCVAVALGATVFAKGPEGERAIPSADLAVTHWTTSLAPAEVITRVELPAAGPRQGSAFVELARRAGDFALVEAAAVVDLDEAGAIGGARAVLGAVADRPVDVSELVAPLVGAAPDAEAVRAVGRAVSEAVDPVDGRHASAAYRKRMAGVLVERALTLAAARAAEGAG
jgi:CO/xanthine dehydrogenase FAD-binding subunit